jgi:F-type H+/Na+-transporting ATPase subunit alpha
LARGGRIIELLKQPQYTTYSFVDQALMLFLLKENFLDTIPKEQVHAFATQFVSFTKSVYKPVYDTISQTADVSDEIKEDLIGIAKEFSEVFAPRE